MCTFISPEEKASIKRHVLAIVVDSAYGVIHLNTDNTYYQVGSRSYSFIIDDNTVGNLRGRFKGNVISILVTLNSGNDRLMEFESFVINPNGDFTEESLKAAESLRPFSASIKLMDLIWRDKWD